MPLRKQQLIRRLRPFSRKTGGTTRRVVGGIIAAGVIGSLLGFIGYKGINYYRAQRLEQARIERIKQEGQRLREQLQEGKRSESEIEKDRRFVEELFKQRKAEAAQREKKYVDEGKIVQKENVGELREVVDELIRLNWLPEKDIIYSNEAGVGEWFWNRYRDLARDKGHWSGNLGEALYYSGKTRKEAVCVFYLHGLARKYEKEVEEIAREEASGAFSDALKRGDFDTKIKISNSKAFYFLLKMSRQDPDWMIWHDAEFYVQEQYDPIVRRRK